MTTLKAIRGTRDLLPPETALWNKIEATARSVFARYNFGEIRTPIFEDTALFARGVGARRNRYRLERNVHLGRSRSRPIRKDAIPHAFALKTPPALSALTSNTSSAKPASCRSSTNIGPQFRRERPQRGRYRQFSQIGAEVIGPASAGSESPLRDAEVLEMLATLLDELDIKGWTLKINSVGSASDRPAYIAKLKEALKPVVHQMCEDCRRRAETNPLRVLDCKVPHDQPFIEALPKIADSLDEASRSHFAHRSAPLSTRPASPMSVTTAWSAARLLHPHHL